MNDSVRQLFLDAIVDDPSDDTPRLVYADWLDEQGDPRGEFIRVQCQLERIDELHPDYVELFLRNDELLYEHGQAWLAEVRANCPQVKFAPAYNSSLKFSRGFVDELVIHGKDLARGCTHLIRQTAVRSIRVNYYETLDSIAPTAPLDCLNFWNTHGCGELVTVLRSTGIRIRELQLSGENYRSDPAPVLSAAAEIGTLTELHLHGGWEPENAPDARIDFPRVQALTLNAGHARDSFRGLRNLNFPSIQSVTMRGHCDEETATELGESLGTSLSSLDLYAKVSSAAANALVKAGCLKNIKRLNLEGKQWSLRTARTVLASAHLSNCEELSFMGTSSRGHSLGEHIMKLAREGAMLQLRRLAIARVEMKYVNQLMHTLEHLSALEIDEAHFDGDSSRKFTSSPAAQRLSHLTISSPQISADSVLAFCSNRLPNLRVLRLRGRYGFGSPQRTANDTTEKWTEDAIRVLLESGAFPNVRLLDLTDIALSEDMLAGFATANSFPSLKVLMQNRTGISVELLKMPGRDKLILKSRQQIADQYMREFGGRLIGSSDVRPPPA